MKRMFPLLLVLMLCAVSALADPLNLQEDLCGSISEPCDENDPSAGTFAFSYRYPCVNEEGEDGAAINAFFRTKAEYLEYFTIPMYRGENASTEWTYTVTCNNDDYFSVLLKREKTTEDGTAVKWEACVFSRKNPDPGSSYTLPKLLNILDADENEEWIREHQNEKANEAVRGLVWDMMEENEAGIEYYPDYLEEYLLEDLNPEEDYYLDEDGEPVFYLNPGIAAPVEFGLLIFPITLEEIDDEL